MQNDHALTDHETVQRTTDAGSTARPKPEQPVAEYTGTIVLPAQYAYTAVRHGAASLHESVGADKMPLMYRIPFSTAPRQMTARVDGRARWPALWAGMGVRTRMRAALA